MKRAIWTIATLAALTCPRAGAEFVDEFLLVRSLPFVANVDNSASNAALIIVRYVGPKLDELGGRRAEEVAEIVKIPTGQRVSVTFSRPGRGVKLAIIEVDNRLGGFTGVEIRQGANGFSRGTPSGVASFRMVFDVVGPEQ